MEEDDTDRFSLKPSPRRFLPDVCLSNFSVSVCLSVCLSVSNLT